jgi:hypothetical protein
MEEVHSQIFLQAEAYFTHLREKADSFSKQYLRTCFHDTIKFYLCAVRAENYSVLTIFQWEAELKRQIKELLQTKNPNWLPESHSENMIQELAEVTTQHPREGLLFTFKPNWDRSEVFPSCDRDGQSLLGAYFDIIDDICQPENSTCVPYQSKLQEINSNKEVEAEERRSLNVQGHAAQNVTPEIMQDLEVLYRRHHALCYKDGYKANGTTNIEGLGGGGNLPLSSISAFKIAIGFFNAIPYEWWKGSQQQDNLSVLWIGK